MGWKPDKLTVDDATLLSAVSRENTIRRDVLLPRFSPAQVIRALPRPEIGASAFL